MVVKDQPFELYQGNRRILVFGIVEEDGPGYLDLSGMTVTFAVARTNDEGVPLRNNPVIDLSSADLSTQVAITDAVNGAVQVTLDCPDTETLAAGSYYWELEVHDDSCKVVVATGTMTLLTNVNNA